MATDEVQLANGDGSRSGDRMEQVIELVSDLQQRVDRLEQNKSELEEQVDHFKDETQRLREENEELRADVENLQENTVTRTSINIVLDDLCGGGVDDFTQNPTEHRSSVQDFNARVKQIENTVKSHDSTVSELGSGRSNSKEEAWIATVRSAANLQTKPQHGLPDNKVAMFADNIEQATGYSNRRCCDLIEEFGDEKDGATWRPYSRNTQTTNGKVQRKRLIIDLDDYQNLLD